MSTSKEEIAEKAWGRICDLTSAGSGRTKDFIDIIQSAIEEATKPIWKLLHESTKLLANYESTDLEQRQEFYARVNKAESSAAQPKRSEIGGIIIPQHPPPDVTTVLRKFVDGIEGYKETGVWPDNGQLRRWADEGLDALNGISRTGSEHEFKNESCVKCGVHEVHANVPCKSSEQPQEEWRVIHQNMIYQGDDFVGLISDDENRNQIVQMHNAALKAEREKREQAERECLEYARMLRRERDEKNDTKHA